MKLYFSLFYTYLIFKLFNTASSLGHPNLEMSMSQVEKKLSEGNKEPIRYSNLLKKERQNIRFLADDRSNSFERGVASH